MARTITLAYVDKCAATDPHIRFSVRLNGVERMKISCGSPIGDLMTETISREDSQEFAELLLRMAVREWYRDNPTADPHSLTGPQLTSLRNFVEAKAWEF